MRNRERKYLREVLKDSSQWTTDNLRRAQEMGLDISFAYPILMERLCEEDYTVRFNAQHILTSAAAKDPAVMAGIVSMLEHAHTNMRTHAVYILNNLSEEGQDISPAISSLEKRLSDHESPIALYAAKALSRYHLRCRRWHEVESLMGKESDSALIGTLQSLREESEKNTDLTVVLPTILAMLDHRFEDDDCNGNMRVIIENMAKKVPLSTVPLLERTCALDSTFTGEVRALAKFMLRISRCEVCRELPATLIINVDDELPATARKLNTLCRYDAMRAGIECYGLLICPRCGSVYYDERECSHTGSGMNDYEYLYRLYPEEMEMIEPIIGRVNGGKAGKSLDDARERVLAEMSAFPYRGNSRRVILYSILKTSVVMPFNEYAAELLAHVRRKGSI